MALIKAEEWIKEEEENSSYTKISEKTLELSKGKWKLIKGKLKWIKENIKNYKVENKKKIEDWLKLHRKNNSEWIKGKWKWIKEQALTKEEEWFMNEKLISLMKLMKLMKLNNKEEWIKSEKWIIIKKLIKWTNKEELIKRVELKYLFKIYNKIQIGRTFRKNLVKGLYSNTYNIKLSYWNKDITKVENSFYKKISEKNLELTKEEELLFKKTINQAEAALKRYYMIHLYNNMRLTEEGQDVICYIMKSAIIDFKFSMKKILNKKVEELTEEDEQAIYFLFQMAEDEATYYFKELISKRRRKIPEEVIRFLKELRKEVKYSKEYLKKYKKDYVVKKYTVVKKYNVVVNKYKHLKKRNINNYIVNLPEIQENQNNNNKLYISEKARDYIYEVKHNLTKEQIAERNSLKKMWKTMSVKEKDYLEWKKEKLEEIYNIPHPFNPRWSYRGYWARQQYWARQHYVDPFYFLPENEVELEKIKLYEEKLKMKKLVKKWKGPSVELIQKMKRAFKINPFHSKGRKK